MNSTIRRVAFAGADRDTAPKLLHREWLATNGVGGYASGTISGDVTWRYHGLLVAALPAPFGRFVMLNHLTEFLRIPDQGRFQFGGGAPGGPEEVGETEGFLTEFRLENGLPIWSYDVKGVLIEKHVVFLYGQNTVHINYRLMSNHEGLSLELSPSMQFRGHEQAVALELNEIYRLFAEGTRYEISTGENSPRLRLTVQGEEPVFHYDGGSRREIYYSKEAERGYQSRGCLWSPGHFSVRLSHRRDATLVASTEPWHTMLALTPAEARQFYHDRHCRIVCTALGPKPQSPASDLVLAADQFIITPVGRLQDSARAHAAGDEIRTVIAGYHWFTDWGRDTMISLEGLTLTTKRWTEAGWILRTFAHYVRDGLIPNLFPEGENTGLYHTADATLWFFHALDRYVSLTGDRETLRGILPKLIDIMEHHIRGTRFGIRVDPHDGLLQQGAPGYQLTWMDAKVEDWVVTPRRGKAVELNGLWFNALKLFEEWLAEEQGAEAAKPYTRLAAQVEESFNRRFWYEQGKHLYDLVDTENGDDPSCRPNQLIAFSLKHPVLRSPYWRPVLEVVRDRLLTPVGLRSLAPGSPDYKAKYFGDLRARDAAYHQGTVWAWLIGPFIDAWLKVYPADHAGARGVLAGFIPHLDEGCVGSVNEIFDADPPYTPRGCIAQAWSVAEVLRAWIKSEPPENGGNSGSAGVPH